MHSMLGLVERHHMSRAIDTDISQRSTLPPQTTGPNLLVILLLISEVGQALPLKRSKDSFVSNKVADLHMS